MTTIVLATTYEVEDCLHCGFLFGLPEGFVRRRRRDHKSFYCPSCQGGMRYSAKSDIELVREKLRRKTECCDFYTKRTATLVGEVEHERAVARGYKGLAVKRQKALQAAKGENGATHES